MKPLTKCQPYLWRELDGTPSIVVIDTESGSYYRASEADARIAELEAERDAARADVTALQFSVDQQRILAGFGDTDLRLARQQRDTAYRILRRIAGYTMSQFANAHDLADACIQEARELFPEEDDTHG